MHEIDPLERLKLQKYSDSRNREYTYEFSELEPEQELKFD